MAFVIIDETTAESEIKQQPAIVNGHIYHLIDIGKTTVLGEEVSAFLRIPNTSTIQQGKALNNIAAVRVKKTGAGPKTHLWKMRHIDQQHRNRVDHLDLLLILPRENSNITLQFSKRGGLDFAHRDAQKIYLGIRLYHGEALRITARTKLHFLATTTSSHNWKLLRDPVRHNQTWRSTATVVA